MPLRPVENIVGNTPHESLFEAIYTRRSVRNYSMQRVNEKQIELLLDSAVHAPSALNSQPWAFVVVQDEDLLKRISDAVKQTILETADTTLDLRFAHIPLRDPKFSIFYGASTLITVCVKEEPGFCPIGDCYLAAENLMLAAHGIGLGSCVIGLARDVLKTDEFRDVLGIPFQYSPLLPIAVGYPIGPTSLVPDPHPPKILSWIRKQIH